MSSSFIAAALVILTMSGFLIFAMKGMISELHRHMDIQVGRILCSYDEAADEKSRKLMAMQELEEEQKKRTHALNEDKTPHIIPIYMEMEQAVYADERLFACYALIAHEFHDTAEKKAMERMEQLIRIRRDVNVHEYRELLALFDGGLQYEMVTLGEERQREIMRIVSENSLGKKRILERFLSDHVQFDFEAFMDHVREYIFSHDTMVYVRIAPHRGAAMPKAVNLNILADDRIHEGCIVTCRNHLYDYSL